MKSFPKLFSRTSLGQIQTWQIFCDHDYFWAEEGIEGGSITKSEPNVCVPKNIGKKNESSGPQQAESEAQSKFDKKLKGKYHLSVEDIDKPRFFAPMGCQKYKEHVHKIDFSKGVAVENKLNGIKAVFTSEGAFSKTGEEFFCVEHIKDALKPIFAAYPDAVFDGELFNLIYRNQLNEISKLVSVNRKAKDVTEEDIKRSRDIVQFHVYDGLNFAGIDKDTPFATRKSRLEEVIRGTEFCYFHSYIIVDSDEEVQKELQKTKDLGTEGIVIKILGAPYQNKKSRHCLKLKNWMDEEFEIIGFELGTGNWAHCVKLVNCKLNKPATDGRGIFDSNIKGSMEELSRLWVEKDQHIWKKCTVVFQEYSPYGIPLIPYTELPFRDYE